MTGEHQDLEKAVQAFACSRAVLKLAQQARDSIKYWDEHPLELEQLRVAAPAAANDVEKNGQLAASIAKYEAK